MGGRPLFSSTYPASCASSSAAIYDFVFSYNMRDSPLQTKICRYSPLLQLAGPPNSVAACLSAATTLIRLASKKGHKPFHAFIAPRSGNIRFSANWLMTLYSAPLYSAPSGLRLRFPFPAARAGVVILFHRTRVDLLFTSGFLFYYSGCIIRRESGRATRRFCDSFLSHNACPSLCVKGCIRSILTSFRGEPWHQNIPFPLVG